jgi:hypothetical protein
MNFRLLLAMLVAIFVTSVLSIDARKNHTRTTTFATAEWLISTSSSYPGMTPVTLGVNASSSTLNTTFAVPASISATFKTRNQIDARPSIIRPASTASKVTPTVGPSFSCDKYGYLVQKTGLYQVNILTGFSNLIKKPIVNDSNNINAIGYNVLDHFIYGYHHNNGIIRISFNGSTQKVAPLASGGNIGDVDSGGHYWLSNNGTKWYDIDLAPGSDNYGKIVANGTADNLGLSIADWAYIPSEGLYLWSVASNITGNFTVLTRFGMKTHAFEVVAQYPKVPIGNWEAVFVEDHEKIFAMDSTTGHIWQFSVLGGAPSKVSHGPQIHVNDGARCAWNIVT